MGGWGCRNVWIRVLKNVFENKKKRMGKICRCVDVSVSTK
jgi:hypothetical protein